MTSIYRNFEALAEDKHPIVVVVLRDVSSGRILIPSKLVFKYNGTELAFGRTAVYYGTVCRHVQKSNRIQCQCGLAVLFHDRTSRHEEPRAHLGYDNDRITISGEVEIGGHTAEFNELATNVIIQESSGKQYELFITSDKGTQIVNPADVLALKASLYSGGDLINDLGNITLQWKKHLPFRGRESRYSKRTEHTGI